MKVWITRTQPGAARTAARLAQVGIDSLIDPALQVRPLDASLDLTGFDALAFTSPNAVSVFSARSSDRTLPAFAVGEATADCLADAGFRDIRIAGGDVRALAQALVDQTPRRILHLAPMAPAANLGSLAAPLGIEVVVRPVYETVAITPNAALGANDLIAVMIHSARAGAVVAERAKSRLGALTVLALSSACAAPFADVASKSVAVAPFPDDASLVRLTIDTLSKARA